MSTVQEFQNWLTQFAGSGNLLAVEGDAVDGQRIRRITLLKERCRFIEETEQGITFEVIDKEDA